MIDTEGVGVDVRLVVGVGVDVRLVVGVGVDVTLVVGVGVVVDVIDGVGVTVGVGVGELEGHGTIPIQAVQSPPEFVKLTPAEE